MDLSELLTQREYVRTYRKLDLYKPYKYQKKFHAARGLDEEGRETDKLATIKALFAGNQIGKTSCAANEVAMHLTGIYPDWWEGWRFTGPINALCGSNTNEQTRDLLQKELFGEPTDPKMLGTGAIPKDLIVETMRKPGVPNAFDSAIVRHVDGGVSKIMFRAYEQGNKKHMGLRIQLGWMDEEPPSDIYSQYLRGTIATNGRLMMTMTPENGMTDIVDSFLNNPRPGMAVIRATWDDVDPDKNNGEGHLTKERQAELLNQMSPHERDMRSKGIPVMGSGMIFPVPDEDIACKAFDIPAHWPRIVGMDFGWDHPTAVVWMAHDRETDEVYIYSTFRQSKTIIPVIADAIKQKGQHPIAWPHDGMQHDKATGKPLAELYRDRGLNMLPKPFSNPPAPGEKEGQGGQGVEVGLFAIHTAMEEGRFHVFDHLTDWFKEKQTYYRKDGKVVKLNDDLMSATRYAFQSLRFADNNIVAFNQAPTYRGISNW